MQHPQKRLIQELWPDKLVYATTMVLLTSILGAVQAVLLQLAPLQMAAQVPRYLHPLDNFWTLLLCLVAAGLAYWAMRARSLTFAWVGVVAGLLSGALVGLAALFSLVAAGFLVQAKREGEHENPHTAVLHVLDWPDKSLAASLVSLVNGALTLGWAALLLTGEIQLGSVAGLVWGSLAAVAGALSLGAAWQLYRQRGRGLGIAAALVSIPAASAVGVGAVLGIITLGLIWKATVENEFTPTAAPA